jgi:hypothetical protein
VPTFDESKTSAVAIEKLPVPLTVIAFNAEAAPSPPSSRDISVLILLVPVALMTKFSIPFTDPAAAPLNEIAESSAV